MSDHADLFARAEMRWMSVESSEMKVRARTIAEIGRELGALREAAMALYERVQMDESVGICLSERVTTLALGAALTKEDDDD
jgi:hypothetical protein